MPLSPNAIYNLASMTVQLIVTALHMPPGGRPVGRLGKIKIDRVRMVSKVCRVTMRKIISSTL